jgi:hypothetical protein
VLLRLSQVDAYHDQAVAWDDAAAKFALTGPDQSISIVRYPAVRAPCAVMASALVTSAVFDSVLSLVQ